MREGGYKEYTKVMRKFIIIAAAAVVVLVGAVGVVLVRSHTVTGQGPALYISEAGVEYALHLLNSGACTPDELTRQQPIVQAVPNVEFGEPLGMFAITFDDVKDTSERLRFNVLGRSGGIMGACHAMAAEVESFSGVLGTKYRVVSRSDQGATRCGNLSQLSKLSCGGLEKPKPSE